MEMAARRDLLFASGGDYGQGYLLFRHFRAFKVGNWI